MADVKVKFLGDKSQISRTIGAIKQESQGLGGGFTAAAGALKSMALPALGAAAAVFKLANDAGQTADRLLDLEQITGVSTDKLQEMEHVSRVAGTTQEFYANSVNEVVKAMDRIERGTGPAAEALEKLNIATKNADGSMRSAQAITDDSIDALMGLEDASLRASLAEDIFKRKAQELIPVMALGADGIDAARQAAHDLGVVQSGEALDAANEYRIAMEEVTARMEGMQIALAQKAIPVVEYFIDVIDKAGEGVEQLGVMISSEGRIDELKASFERSVVVVEEYNELIRQGESHTRAYAAAVEGVALVTPQAAESQRKAAEAAFHLAEGLDAATVSAIKNADEQRKLVDPLFALRDAQGRQRDAEDKLIQLRLDGKAGTEEYADAEYDLVEAVGDAQYAEEQYRANADETNEAFRTHAEDAGFAADEINRMVDALERASGAPRAVRGTPRPEGSQGGFIEGLDFTPQSGSVVVNMQVDASGNPDPEQWTRDSARALNRELEILKSGQNRPI